MHSSIHIEEKNVYINGSHPSVKTTFFFGEPVKRLNQFTSDWWLTHDWSKHSIKISNINIISSKQNDDVKCLFWFIISFKNVDISESLVSPCTYFDIATMIDNYPLDTNMKLESFGTLYISRPSIFSCVDECFITDAEKVFKEYRVQIQ